MLRSAAGFRIVRGMDFLRCLAVALSLSLLPAAFAQKPAKSQPQADIEHIREELGVNEFTAPSIELVFQELSYLRPIPFDKVWRDLPEGTPQNRARLALAAGGVIADGFLAVTAERQSRIEPVGRHLMRLAKGLGVGDSVNKHSRSILEKAAKKDWGDVKKELVRAQAEVEAAMLQLKDEEIAHLVALGGWLRGLEMTAGTVVEDYSPERARRLVQPELMDYFIDRVSSLNPTFKKTKLGQMLGASLKEVQVLTTKPVNTPIDLADAKRVRDVARELNRAIAKDEE
jgi:hypothetical protein